MYTIHELVFSRPAAISYQWPALDSERQAISWPTDVLEVAWNNMIPETIKTQYIVLNTAHPIEGETMNAGESKVGRATANHALGATATQGTFNIPFPCVLVLGCNRQS